MADEELARAAAAGREDAFMVLCRRYEARIRGFFARRLPSIEDAEEAVQDTFVKVRRGARTFNGARDFKPWLGAIARNVLRDRLRASPGIETVPLVSDDLAVYRTPPGGEEIREAIGALPKPYRAALALKYVAGMSYREAAAELGISERGFETRLARAKEKLRGELARRGRGIDGLR